MSEITKDKLWRLHKLCVAVGVERFTIEIAPPGDDTGAAFQHNGYLRIFATIQEAIDYLNPPTPPTADEWHEAFTAYALSRKRIGSSVDEENALNELKRRHERAKAARRDEGSMFNLRGED